METVILTVLSSIISFLSIYSVLLLIRILLTWFPNVNWSNQPFAALSQITDPYLEIFRSFIPPMGGWDLSSVIAIFALQMLSRVLISLYPSAVSPTLF